MSNIKPLNPGIPKEEVDRLFRKLKDTGLPKEPIDCHWNGYTSCNDYWLDSLSWLDAQRSISQWHRFTTESKDLLSTSSTRKRTCSPTMLFPPLLVYGWLGTFYEFQIAMHPLLEPSKDSDTTLGYKLHVAQAGDWEYWVVLELGIGNYECCKAAANNWHCLSGNPVGIMMFVGEKYYELADPSLGIATLDNDNFNDGLCTTQSLYFFTSPWIITSMLSYYNNVRHKVYTELKSKEENLIKVPLRVSTFPFDAYPVSEKITITTGNLQWFKDFRKHFACVECPTEMKSNVREFFGKFYEY
ncbi:alpha/beta-hydrolase [Zopfia rhizophila CBS 207.26]|uniref:Alpha/beta-hydrolase n=1 Tax=Zopfia rhizophila CBS 207.26 TaxID=1314779 RepID=A0A6A6EXL2_9PEZI|nr:alpha/beta-hydrolase [Zopfia rhizophila CBS 207.26]